MAKIDYSKAEAGMTRAIERMNKKKLQEGKSITSDQASLYFRLNEQGSPISEDAVESLLDEEKIRTNNPETATETEEEYEELGQVRDEIPFVDTIQKARPRMGFKKPPVETDSKQIEKKAKETSSPSQLILLRKHILWLKMRGIQDRYEKIGSSKEEIFALRKKTLFTSAENIRIQQLIKNSEKVKQEILQKEEKGSDEGLIEKQKKEHKNKYLSVRERWLKL